MSVCCVPEEERREREGRSEGEESRETGRGWKRVFSGFGWRPNGELDGSQRSVEAARDGREREMGSRSLLQRLRETHGARAREAAVRRGAAESSLPREAARHWRRHASFTRKELRRSVVACSMPRCDPPPTPLPRFSPPHPSLSRSRTHEVQALTPTSPLDTSVSTVRCTAGWTPHSRA